jgi:hypothetical protein
VRALTRNSSSVDKKCENHLQGVGVKRVFTARPQRGTTAPNTVNSRPSDPKGREDR